MSPTWKHSPPCPSVQTFYHYVPLSPFVYTLSPSVANEERQGSLFHPFLRTRSSYSISTEGSFSDSHIRYTLYCLPHSVILLSVPFSLSLCYTAIAYSSLLALQNSTFVYLSQNILKLSVIIPILCVLLVIISKPRGLYIIFPQKYLPLPAFSLTQLFFLLLL